MDLGICRLSWVVGILAVHVPWFSELRMHALWLLAAALLTPLHPAIAPAPDDYPRRIGIDIENYRFEITLSDDRDRALHEQRGDRVASRFDGSGRAGARDDGRLRDVRRHGAFVRA